MEDFTNLIAQANYSPTWNVYLCWFLICLIIYLHLLRSIRGVESLDEATRINLEGQKLIVNGKFTLWWKSMPIWAPAFIALCHDVFVVFLNQGEMMIVLYNKMFFSQFLSFSTISNLLTSL
tara:strand:- start:2738 stop:3100 length:363 start_codon:yes stop_codon:yes gene_type:complete